ncbi:putative translation factor [Lactiplantibacillus plantarum]|jgi:hypothetical protein|nr:putative translation factor [Lactiplantibacillus plantarum]
MTLIQAKLKSANITSWSGDITYIGFEDPYPFSREELKLNPGKVLLCKPSSYAGQHEFRLIVGGPNYRFPGPVNQSIHLINPSVIKSGNNADELRHLQIFE